mgnify:CR=1 FL=1
MNSRRIFTLLAFLAISSAQAAESELQSQLQAHDTNRNQRLDAAELKRYALAHDPVIARLRDQDISETRLDKAADDFAEDALSALDEPADSISIEQAELFIRRVQEIADSELKDRPIGWKGLQLSRTLTDSSDPRQKKFNDRPLVLSYSHDDNRDGKKGSFVALGSITLNTWTWESGGAPWQLKPGIDLDVDSGKDGNQSSVDLAVKLSRFWSRPNSFFDSHALALTPKFRTDRDFDREAYEATIGWSFSSERMLRAGYMTWIGGTKSTPDDAYVKAYWVPELKLEAGNVEDAAGNEGLQAIEDSGSYTRIAPQASLTIYPPFLSPRLSVTFDYTYRHDFEESWDRKFWQAGANYNLSKNVQLTLLYRTGRKAPDFADTDTVLFGVGLLQQ